MATPDQGVLPVQLLAFVLVPGPSWDEGLLAALAAEFGPLLHTGQLHSFAGTGYYADELGDTPHRGVLSFANLCAAEAIGSFKYRSNAFEERWSAGSAQRRVNIDIGYMDTDKIVLPSFKKGPCKLYAGAGVWLDMLMTYAKGRFHPTAWAFADFKLNPYTKDLLLVREKYKKALHRNQAES